MTSVGRASSAVFQYKGYTVQQWSPAVRDSAAEVVRVCLEQYGLQFEPKGADRDAIEARLHVQK